MDSGSSGSKDRVTIARHSEETLPGVSERDVWAMSEQIMRLGVDCEDSFCYDLRLTS